MTALPIRSIARAYRRFLPRWVDEEDLNQELLFALWKDPELARFPFRQKGALIDVLRKLGLPRSLHSSEAYNVRFPISLVDTDFLLESDTAPQQEARSLLCALLSRIKTERERKVLLCLWNGDNLRHTGYSDTWNSLSKTKIKRKLQQLMKE